MKRKQSQSSDEKRKLRCEWSGGRKWRKEVVSQVDDNHTASAFIHTIYIRYEDFNEKIKSTSRPPGRHKQIDV